jgi:hypothetical protein
LSFNDKLGSFLGRLHSDCHNLILLLVVLTQYLNTIYVTISLISLYVLLVSYNDRRPDDSDMIGGSHDGVPGLLVLLSLEINFPKLWSLGDRMDH